MERTKIVRGLRIAWSVVFGILCVLLVVLWVRSYWRWDTVAGCIFQRGVVVRSRDGEMQGAISTQLCALSGKSKWKIGSRSVYTSLKTRLDSAVATKVLDREWDRIPHWLFFVTMGMFASIPWFHWKFSLRNLLVTTTLIAVV